MSVVFLTGMPGVGKSHWGRIWSRKYNFAHYDLDELIEKKIGKDIPSIIEASGEAEFRTIESEVLVETVARTRSENAIVSCGGGTPTIAQNLSTMRDSGCVVYLQASPEVLLGQLQRSSILRPLLKEVSVPTLSELLDRRREFYERAHLKIPVGTAHPGTFAEILQACINRHS